MDNHSDQRAFDRIRAEFLEMPGMRLMPAQVQRLCGVDSVTCARVLDTLVQLQFLSKGAEGGYRRITDGRAFEGKTAKATIDSLARRAS